MSWPEMVELLHKMSDFRMTLDLDIDNEVQALSNSKHGVVSALMPSSISSYQQTASALKKEEEVELKRLKARVQILYENRWRRGR